MPAIRRTGFAVPFLVLTSCIGMMPTSSGRPINADFVQSIEKGVTTADQVRTNLGSPTSVTQTGDSEEWTYMHWKGKPAMIGTSYSSSQSQILRIQFRGGKVVDYSLTTTTQ